MKKELIALSIALVVIGLGYGMACADNEERLPVGALTAAPQGEGWIALFEGDHQSQWKNVTDKKQGIFEISEGQFIVKGQKPTRYIAYMGDSFADFQLHVEFQTTKDANSGLFFRTDPKNPVQGGFEIQVLDDFGQATSKNSTGGLYDVASPMYNMSLPTGQWNSYDITCKGSELKVVLNGWKVLDTDFALMTKPIGKFDTPLADLPHEGHIILQNHGDDVIFRNLMIKKL